MTEKRDTENNITITPKAGTHSGTMVFMHGLGDSADGWIDTIRQYAQMMPWIKFIVPTAPTRPITLNGGMPMSAWFDIASLSPEDADKMHGTDDTVKFISKIIDDEVAAGVSRERIVLGGFSQGAAMSLRAGLMRSADECIGGVVAFSGFMPSVSSFTVNGSENVPVFQTHGTADPVVNMAWGKLTHELIKSKGCTQLEFMELPGIPHSITNEAITKAAAFVCKIIPDDPSKAIAAKDPSSMSVKELRAAIKEHGLEAKARGLSEKSEFVSLLKSVQ